MNTHRQSRTSLKLALLTCLLWLLLPTAIQAQSPPQPSPEIQSLFDKGTAEQQSHPEAAAQLYAQALKMARDRKDRPGEAGALLRLAQPLVFKQPQQSVTYLNQALPIFREIHDPSQEATCLMTLGDADRLLSQPQQALSCFQAARNLYQAQNNRFGQANAQNMIGLVYQGTGQVTKALENFNVSLSLLGTTEPKALRAQIFMNMGACYAALGDMSGAVAKFKESAALYHEAGEAHGEALALGDVGIGLQKMGETQEALKILLQSLQIVQTFAGNPRPTAICLYNLGLIYLDTGDLLKALEVTQQALAILQAIGDRTTAALTVSVLAEIYQNIGQWDEAMARYKQALDLNKDTGNVPDQIQFLFDLGMIYGHTGQLSHEKECYDQALALSENVELKTVKAGVMFLLSDYLRRSGRTQEARDAQEKGRDVCHEIGDRVQEEGAEATIGQMDAQDGQLSQAQAHYARAAEIAHQIGYVDDEALALAGIGAVEEQQHDLAAAEQTYARALALRENVRASLGSLNEAKITYQGEHVDLYQRYIALLLDQKQEAKAFAWTQKAKARVLIDLMQAGKVNVTRAMTEADRKQEHDLQWQEKMLAQKLETELGDLDDLQRQARPDPNRQQQARAQVESTRHQQQDIERQWRAFHDRLYLRNPRLAEQRASRMASLDEVAAYLPKDTALLEYLFLAGSSGARKRDEIALFVVTQKSGRAHLQAFRTAAPTGSLDTMAVALREACAGRPNTNSERPYQSVSRQLYRLLIAPAMPALKGRSRLILCPDGPLWEVPFQALLMPSSPSKAGMQAASRSRFLWEQFALVYSYSATGMKAALEVKRRSDRPQPSQAMLVMADPDFGQHAPAPLPVNRSVTSSLEQPTARDFYVRGGRLGALPYTRVEANAIRASFPEATLKTGTKAQESLVKQVGSHYRYLHFATHALFNDAAPMLSGIVFATPPQNSPEDGILTVRELFDMNLTADMLVLSACETARGSQKPGEGLIGLSWAAFVAGVPTQVVSQWSVDDAATATLMGAFYRGVKQGMTKEVALRNAALSLLRDGTHSHPFYWAPFVLFGDWR